MANFRMLFPEHKDKKLYGIIAAVDISEAIKKRVLAAGFYVARIQDETFGLDTPDDNRRSAFNCCYGVSNSHYGLATFIPVSPGNPWPGQAMPE